ncbi:MAG: universal stress protein [Chloroflexi bacterium]|nr:universal stress protein [Chloroflexota bacterium]
MKIQRILVALDASPHSLAALEAAIDLAERLDAELQGLFVEDINLLRLAQLPFARELRYPLPGSQKWTHCTWKNNCAVRQPRPNACFSSWPKTTKSNIRLRLSVGLLLPPCSGHPGNYRRLYGVQAQDLIDFINESENSLLILSGQYEQFPPAVIRRLAEDLTCPVLVVR